MFFTKPNIPLSNSFYTEPVERVDPANPASLSEQFGQARKEDDAAHEMLSEYWNLGKVYADHNRKVKDLTGVELPNPSEMTFGYFDEDGPSNKARFYGDLQKYRDDGGTGSQTAFYDQWREKVYRERLEEVAAKHPDKRSQIIPDATFQEQGYAARNLEVKKSEDVWNRSRQTTLDRAAWLAGSVWGSFDDPVNLVTMPLGFGGKVATGARGVAMGFLKAGASNAAIEAGIQPFVQDYANRAGDFSGWAPAANAVGAAFLFGGALDAGVRSVARGLRSGMGYEPVVKDGVVESYRKIERDGTTSELPADLVARAGDNDPVAIREVAEKTGLANDPIVRTSLDAMDAETAVMRKPSEAIPDGEHVGAVQQTLRALDDPEHEPFPVIHENASPARVKALELDLLEARTELGRVSKALQISELPPAISKQLNDAQQKITARVAELETQHADMRQTLMSDDLIQMVDGGKVPREVADVVAGHVEDKAIQGRIALDLTDMKVSSPDEARNAISSLLNSPEYRQQVKRPVTPAPGLAKRELDDPYGAEAKAQLAALQAEFSDVLGVKSEADAAPAAEPDFLDAMTMPETPAPKAGPEAKVSAALDEAIAFARKILPEGTEVKVAGELEDGAGRALDAAEVNGTIFLYQHAIDPTARIGHEGVHVLVSRGLLDPKEVKTLAKAARKEGVFSAEQEASYREAYAERENLDSLIDEEAAAHLVEANVGLDPKLQTIIDRVKAFFERLRNAMEGNGFRTADDVIDAILGGDAAKRDADAGWSRSAMFALREGEQTVDRPGYGTPEDKASRVYRIDGAETKGFDNAVDYLTRQASYYAGANGIAKERRATILIGPPGAGKSTIGKVLAEHRRSAIVTADDAKPVIQEYNGQNASAVHVESQDLALAVQQKIMADDGNIFLEKLGSNSNSIAGLSKALTDKGYTVDIVSVTAPRDVLLKRIGSRAARTGRAIPVGEVDAALAGINNTLEKLNEDPTVSGISVIDNGGDAPLLLSGKEVLGNEAADALRRDAEIRKSRMVRVGGDARTDGGNQVAERQALYRLSDYFRDTSVDKVARRLQATNILKLRPWSKHPGRVLAFHGTEAVFPRFDLSKTEDFGLHFGTADQANKFASGTAYRPKAAGEGLQGSVIPVILDLKKVIDLPDLNRWRPVEMVRALDKVGVKIDPRIADIIRHGQEIGQEEFSYRALREELNVQGIDGIRYLNGAEGAGLTWSYIVWEKGKVDSASTGQSMFALRGNLRDSYGKFRVMSKEAGETLQRDFMDIEEDFARRQHANPAELAAAMESERAKLQVQRAAILNAKRQTEALKDITDFKDMYGRNDPAKGFFYLHESFGASGAKDLVNAKKDIQDEVESMMAEIIWFARKGAITGDKRRSWNKGVRTTLENMVREAAGQDTGDKTAKTLANAWGQASEYLRKRFNAAGGDIGKLKNWIMPQYHDPDALLKMGQQKWIDYMMAKGVLDRDAMVNVKTQKPYTDGELRNVLAYTWKNITSDGEFSREIGKSGGKGAKYKQHADHRFIHFKDADAWLKYQKEVGGGDLYAAMIGHISTMSRDIAAMERFGANPELVRQRLKEQILKDAGMGRPNKSMFDELKDKVVELQSTFDAIPTKYESLMNELSKVHGELDAVRSKYAPQLGGKLSKRNVAKVEKLQTELFTIHEQLKEEWGKKTLTPEHQKLAAEISDLMDEMNRIDIYPVMSRDPIQRARRLLKRADELWASFNGTSNVPVNGIIANVLSGTRNLISSSALVFAPISAVTDQATHLGARLLIGMPATKQLASFVKGFTPADRQLALHVGIGLDQAANAFQEQARMIGAFNTRGWTGYVTDRSHAFSFLSPMTQASKVAFGLDYMRWMAGLKDTAFDALDEGPQGMLKRGGFTAADWKALQAVQPEIISGNQMLTRKAIKEQAGDDLAEKFMIMFYRERSRAVIEGTLAGRTAIVSDTQPGSIIGEVSRSAAMLKSFPISYGHLILGQLFRSIMDGKYKSAAAYFAAIGIVGTMLGATAKQLKNVAQGRDPEDMTTAKFWGASFMQSGGAGIFGDFIASNVNRQGAGLATTLAGPLADRLGTVRDATIGNIFQYASDEKTNAGREATNLLRQWTPGALSPWYTRLAYERLIADALQSQVDPDAYGSFKRKVQSRKKTFGNDFFWAPGQGAPARGPNFGAALGR